MSEKQEVGFSLIEILVVIAIIGVLSTFFIPAFNEARRQARDSSRRANVNTLYRALGFYLDKFATYPESLSGECLSGDVNVGQTLEEDTNIITKVPQDPRWPDAEPVAFHGGTTKDYAALPSEYFCFWYFSDNPYEFYLSYFFEKDSNAGSHGIHVMTSAGLIQ